MLLVCSEICARILDEERAPQYRWTIRNRSICVFSRGAGEQRRVVAVFPAAEAVSGLG